jgi:hypothetical protein
MSFTLLFSDVREGSSIGPKSVPLSVVLYLPSGLAAAMVHETLLKDYSQLLWASRKAQNLV